MRSRWPMVDAVLAESGMSERHRSHEASAPSILTFIAADTFSFVLFFAVFMGERFTQPDLFSQSAGRLAMGLGLLNTLIPFGRASCRERGCQSLKFVGVVGTLQTKKTQ